ncbi:variable surface protein [Plasmodium gonderi]|uniref:Variable surface protein n=1 Tax=Plasmodium gonderi TaxID=77519 RepID=A0A1Y1JRI6_PLAGO|nr:variable surface protein [Plasmodium gonderi]GAW84078.1 variable surface protein [Plasmodium gonderi]
MYIKLEPLRILHNYLIYKPQFWKMAKVSFIPFDSISYNKGEQCLIKYIDYTNEIEEQINNFEKNNHSDYCSAWEQLSKNIKIKVVELEECYRERHIQVDINQDLAIKNFIEKCSDKSKCPCNTAPPEKNNDELVSELQHPRENEQKKLDEIESVKEGKIVQDEQNEKDHHNPFNAQIKNKESVNYYRSDAAQQLDASLESTTETGESISEALDFNKTESLSQTIHSGESESPSKLQVNNLQESSTKDRLPDSQHGVRENIETKGDEVQGLATKFNVFDSSASNFPDSGHYTAGALLPITLNNPDSKNVEQGDSFNGNVVTEDAIVGNLSQSDARGNHENNKYLSLGDKPTHNANSGDEIPVGIGTNAISFIGISTPTVCTPKLGIDPGVSEVINTVDSVSLNAHSHGEEYDRGNTCGERCNIYLNCVETNCPELSSDTGIHTTSEIGVTNIYESHSNHQKYMGMIHNKDAHAGLHQSPKIQTVDVTQGLQPRKEGAFSQEEVIQQSVLRGTMNPNEGVNLNNEDSNKLENVSLGNHGNYKSTLSKPNKGISEIGKYIKLTLSSNEFKYIEEQLHVQIHLSKQKNT